METKRGGCHCGNVRYEVTVDLTEPVIECNCSICQSKGLLLAFVPEAHLTIMSPQADLTEYRFNTNRIAHLFCPRCGVEPFGRGTDQAGAVTYAVNVRTLDDTDLSTLTRMPYDGKAV